MYQIFGLKVFLSWCVTVGAAIAILVGVHSGAQELAQWARAATAGATVVSLMVWLLGQTAAFPLICRLPIVRSVFPNINGVWEGETDSNWPLIAKRAGMPVDVNGQRMVTVEICARLLQVTLKLDARSQYSQSKTVFVKVKKDEEHNDIRLWYIYDNVTKKPEQTDSERHFGGAYLDLVKGEEGECLDGVYWTNRNWESGLNTAGRIVLRRSKTPAL